MEPFLVTATHALSLAGGAPGEPYTEVEIDPALPHNARQIKAGLLKPVAKKAAKENS